MSRLAGIHEDSNHATDPLGKITDFTYTAQGDSETVTLPADAGARPTTSYAYTGFTPAGLPMFFLPTGVTRAIGAAQSTTTTSSYLASNAYVPQTTVVDQGSGNSISAAPTRTTPSGTRSTSTGRAPM